MELLQVAIGIAVAIAGVLVIKHMRRQQRAFLSRLSAATGGTDDGRKGSATLDNVRFQYRYQHPGKDAPGRIIVVVPVARDTCFEIEPRTLGGTIAQAIGVRVVRGTPVHVHTGDAGFDDRLLVSAASQDTAQRILSSAETRDSVRQLFARGALGLWYDGEELRTAIAAPSDAVSLNPQRVTALVPSLGAVAAAIAHHAPAAPTLPSEAEQRHRRITLSVWAVALVATAIVFVGYLVYRPMDQGALFRASLGISLPAIAIVLLGLKLTRQERLLGRLTGAFVAFPFLCWFGGGWLNASLDRGKALTHVVPVVAKQRNSHVDTSVTVVSWKDDAARITFDDQKLYYGLADLKQNYLVVTTKPGYFGYDRVTGVAVYYGRRSER